VFVRSTRLNNILSIAFMFALGACGNLGSCGGCSTVGPLPTGGLPADQTVEGGAQIRVTQAGFSKLTSILPSIINNNLGAGVCIPAGGTGYTLGTGADYCSGNQGTCTNGCQVSTSVNSSSISVTAQQTMNVNLSLSFSVSVPINYSVLGLGSSCTLTASSNNLNGNVDITFGIDATTGELTIHVANVNNFGFNLSTSGCGAVSIVLQAIGDIFDLINGSFLGTFFDQLLTPAFDSLVQGLLPHPLGIAGVMDAGKALQGVSPGTTGALEARVVPGGFVSLTNNGMTLGVITGFNADEDPTTRSPALESEPALCVPPIAKPNYAAAPFNLPLTSTTTLNGPNARQTFLLNPAAEFSGSPEPAADLAMGLSRTMLDLLGHHGVTSGAMCLGIGTSYIKQLNVGTLGILVPSLSDLSPTGKDPLLMVTRPQREITFTIGDNTATSPAMTIHFSHFEVDFYAFLYERYTRAFTLDLSMDVGLNLDFVQMPGGPAQIRPTLSGISSSAVTVKVLNSQFVKESVDHLQMILPSVFDLVTPLLGNIGAINVPSFAGFSLTNLKITHVHTVQDDFIALYASLGAHALLKQLAPHSPMAAAAEAKLEAEAGVAPEHVVASARLRSVVTPPAAAVRAALTRAKDGAMPTVTIDTDAVDAHGRPLEWSYRLGDGLWHPFVQASPLVIADRAFAWQGKYTIGVQSRVVGDYRTTSEVTELPVIIDSVAPNVFVDKAELDGGFLVVTADDVVSGDSLEWAFGKPGDTAPTTAWTPSAKGKIATAELEKLIANDDVAVFVKDEAGNVATVYFAPFHGQGSGAGCTCDTRSKPTAGGAVMVFLTVLGLGLLGRRRLAVRRTARVMTGPLATVALWLAASALLSLAPGCSCNHAPAKACELTPDCPADACPKGQLPFCIEGACVCSDDIPLGRVGPYSDVAASPSGNIWVSAYAETHGDLVMAQATAAGRIPDTAWEWVDGVPDGPVVVTGSKIRGGIADDGPDVGMYTSVQIAPDGTPMVSYFDRTTASLKFAAKVNGAWVNHIVDMGTGTLSEFSGKQIGMYTSMTLRSDDGRPGIAYLAHVADNAGLHAEVRYAAAQVPVPMGAADWQFWVVDTAAIPAADPNNPNIYPLPEGLGLFIDSARQANQAPVVAYYDRAAGELKVSKFNPAAGQFSPATVLAGGNFATGGVDAGWSPTIQVDTAGVSHVAYVDVTHDDLAIVSDKAMDKPAIIDDGYRIVGQTVDNLPKPEFHFVGDDAGLLLVNGTPNVVYQDATTQELLLAQQQPDKTWKRTSIAGNQMTYGGSYGFFASAALTPTQIVMSSWVISQPTDENWVEVFVTPTVVQ
jgi:hypothetical protein